MSGKKNISNLEDSFGGGAQFWAYISPQNDTARHVTKWSVRLEHTSSDWFGEITSANPDQSLTTPNLSGIFTVKVTASGPQFKEKQLACVEWSPKEIGCNSNCAGMVGIIASPDGADAQYWTTWDAICS